MKTSPELTLVLPVYNQAGYIAGVVREIEGVLRHAGVDYELILAENRSPDNTLEVLQEIARKNRRARVVEAPIKGYGGAIIQGYALARGRFVAHMGSTGQIEPRLIVECYRIVQKGKADIAKPYRAVRENWLRRANSRAFNTFANLLFSLNTHDTNSCPKVFARQWLKIFDLQFRDSFLDLELLAKARLLNLKIVEVPTHHRPRQAGKSNTSFKTIREFVSNMVRYRQSGALEQWWKNVPEQYKLGSNAVRTVIKKDQYVD